MVMKVAHVDPIFWKGKKVFLTGHTGFKGSWLSLWLASMGAKVTGYALVPNTATNLFNVLSIDSVIEKSHISDVRDLVSLQNAMSEAKPDVVIHMAAQPLVRYSYAYPVETYATNVMGTVHVQQISVMRIKSGFGAIVRTSRWVVMIHTATARAAPS
jgi:CDP-glucose 4,6-dehydratase